MIAQQLTSTCRLNADSPLSQDRDLLAVLGDLLDTDDVDRLTAQQTLQQAYFCLTSNTASTQEF